VSDSQQHHRSSHKSGRRAFEEEARCSDVSLLVQVSLRKEGFVLMTKHADRDP
jgi:hypothetical protein